MSRKGWHEKGKKPRLRKDSNSRLLDWLSSVLPLELPLSPKVLYHKHVGLDDFLLNRQNQLLHFLEPVFVGRRIEPILLGLDLSGLQHPLVAGPVIPEERVGRDQLVQGDESREQLTEFLEHNLE